MNWITVGILIAVGSAIVGRAASIAGTRSDRDIPKPNRKGPKIGANA